MDDQTQNPVLPNQEIEQLVTQGKGLTRYKGKVIFVDNAIPGDIADIQLTNQKKDYSEGTAIRFKERSSHRTTPFCDHFELCGGCKLQHIQYQYQTKFKEKAVKEAFNRIGKLDISQVDPIIPAEKQRFFRNKLEFTFSNKGWKDHKELRKGIFDWSKAQNVLGFHLPNQWDKLLDIDYCHLQADPSNDIRLAVRDYSKEKGLDFFDKKKQTGFLRNLIIRITTQKELMVIVSFYRDQQKAREQLLTYLSEKFPAITSLLYVINSKANDTIDDLPVKQHTGRGYIIEALEELRFMIGPKSFFQTNTEQALQLYQKIRSFADLQGDEILYDLYSGIGTIGLFLAKHCKKVVGIEQVKEAVDFANSNAKLNDLSNTLFLDGLIQNRLTKKLTAQHGQPTIVVTNPGRRGMHKRVIRKLKGIQPRKIIYVSCNPTTQARDIKRLVKLYDIKAIQPVDMFPQTAHVENVVLLQRKPSAE